ncbi:MAG: hypothetical protein HGGPFJEG_00834 [Ignavibacteria bacterium]|nr:hypothetical protein [Ignavibacteria bacterium]
MTCKNCGNELNGMFCSNCGQKHIEGRFNLKDLLHNFFHAFTHLDRGILFLIKELFFRPGIVSAEYINGKRIRYFNPLQFLILAVAVSTFIAVNYSLFGPKINTDTISGIEETQRFFLEFNVFIYKYFNLIIFISVPVISVYSYLFYKSSGYNFAENLIFNTFISGERTVFYILLTPFLYFFKQHWYIIIGFYYIGWIFYFGFAYCQFFKGKTKHIILRYILLIIIFVISAQLLSIFIFSIFFYKGKLIQ